MSLKSLGYTAALGLALVAPVFGQQTTRPKEGMYIGKTGTCTVIYTREGGRLSQSIDCNEKIGGITISRTTIDSELASIFYHGADKIEKSLVVLPDKTYNYMRSNNIDTTGYAKESDPALESHKKAHSELARDTITPKNHIDSYIERRQRLVK